MPISPGQLDMIEEMQAIIDRHPESDRLFGFVQDLTEFFDATAIVLILRAAERAAVI